ncbi:MAG: response regulator [Deltaproteobacteria bacterium]|jgi:two-component system chemotaxis response regulator CheY|nr:response regulator [Deltaproteobacteria bacterium]
MTKRILIVDDSNFMRHRIVQCLTKAGHRIVGKAKDGDEAVDLYRDTQPDVVTMDITMRGKDGIAAAREILAMNPEATIIFYTLLEIPNMAERIQKLPIKKVIKKGDEEDLLRTLAAMA